MTIHVIPTHSNFPEVRAADLPAFVAGAVTVSPGSDHVSEYVIPENLVLSAGSTITIDTTGSPPIGNYRFSCYALALGYTITIAGSPGGNIGTFATSMVDTGPMGFFAWFDGTNFVSNGRCFLASRV